VSGALDCACKKHDDCYDKCGLNAGTRWSSGSALASPCALLCDAKLAGSAMGGSDDCRPSCSEK
jgi:hypothetical protein